MALECELKYKNVDLDTIRTRLEQVGAEGGGPYFESNLVFDYENRTLKESGTLLRLRLKRDQAVLTVKKPPEADIPSTLKVFEEIESIVDDFETVRKALEAIGLKVAFAYEKVREKWTFMGCTVCLDRLPYGDFVEIEGTEATVPACARSLGLDGSNTTKETYHALNIEYCLEAGLDYEESFVFSPEAREAIEKEIGKD